MHCRSIRLCVRRGVALAGLLRARCGGRPLPFGSLLPTLLRTSSALSFAARRLSRRSLFLIEPQLLRRFRCCRRPLPFRGLRGSLLLLSLPLPGRRRVRLGLRRRPLCGFPLLARRVLGSPPGRRLCNVNH